MQISNFNQFQTARFDRATLKILLDLDSLSSSGQSPAIHQALFKALTVYIESIPNVPIETIDDNTGERDTDDTYYWIKLLFDILYKVFENIQILDCLREYKTGTKKPLSTYLENEINKISQSISEYEQTLADKP